MTHPQPFGRFELLDRISAGGMAEVFRARDNERGGDIVALKKILPHVAEDEEFIQMFTDEARIASQLEHPHIARMLDFGRIGSSYYIAFEYVRGKDLRVIFDRAVKLDDRIPLPVLLYAIARIGEGLSYAHARRDAAGQPVSIVHRDVSPQNIILSFRGDVKLIDFGIAKAAGKLSRTAVGAIKGKFGYMSPEQVRGIDIDQRTDVFSLGITMWELLTRQRLFAAANELLVLERIRSLVVPAPSSVDPTLPSGLDDIVLRALAKNLAERYPSCKEFYRDLNILAQKENLVATREDVAAFMQKAFAEPAEDGSPDPHSGTRDVAASRDAAREMPNLGYNESSIGAGAPGQVENMAGANDKRSDLDIFEGLGKKAGPAPARSSAPPAPPPSRATGVPPPPPPVSEVAKKTLMGLPPPAGSARPPMPPVGPSRTTNPGLPPPSAPPVRPSAPPPPPAAPAASSSGGMDMDWDDEDEATHIFDKDADSSKVGPFPSAPKPAAGMPAIAAPPPSTGRPPPPPPSMNPLGTTVPPSAPPPGGRSAPPPPPANNFPRPPSSAHAMPLSANPLMGQVATEPMKMPPRPPSNMPPPPPPSAAFAMTQPIGAASPFLSSGTAAAQGPAPVPPPQSQVPSQSPSQAPYEPPVQQASRAMEATALVRPPPSRTGLIAGLVVALVAVVAAAFFLMPRTGNIAVNVTDAKGGGLGPLEVYVDGRKVCDTAPCRIDQVKAGSHELKVSAQGYDQPAAKLVAVESGKDVQVDLVLNQSGAKGSGFRVTGTQPGVELLVDNNPKGALPAEVRDLEPGPHTLKFVGTLKSAKNEDRYAPLEKVISVSKDEIQTLEPVTLKVIIGKATLALDTSDAKVKLVASNGDQRTPDKFPVTFDVDTSKASWTIEATKVGLNDFKQPISFDDGQAEKVFTIHLDPKGTTTTLTGTSGGGAVSHPSGGGGGGGGAGGAHLTINALPVAGTVAILDGHPIGAVPKKDYAVSAGTHTILFVNADKNLRKSVTVTVADGESKPAFTKLDE